MADREALGCLVREVWVEWAREQPDPKPSWLTGWDDLDGGQREVDMRIGEAVAAMVQDEGRGLPGHSLGKMGMAFTRVAGVWTAAPSPTRGVAVRGHGVCSCGAFSPVLASNHARQRWHREHKAAVRAEGVPVGGDDG